MLIASFIIILVISVFIIINFRNRFTFALAVKFYGIVVLMFASMLYISKFSKYSVPFQIEYNLYLWLSTVKIHLINISRLSNLGTSILMLSSVFLINTLKPYKWYINLLFFLLIGLFLFWNDPDISWRLYLWLNNASDSNKIGFINTVIKSGKDASVYLVLFFFILPYYRLIVSYLNTRANLKKKYIAIFSWCILIIDTFIYFVFFNGCFSNIMFNNVDLLKFPTYTVKSSSFILIPVLLLIILMMVESLTLYYKLFNTFVIISKREMVRSSKMLSKNLRMILHSYKNQFISVEKLAVIGDGYSSSSDCEMCKSTFEEIRSVALESIDKVGKTLDLIREIVTEYKLINLVECVDNALNKTFIPQNIRVIKNYLTNGVYVYGDNIHLSEVFQNIFINSVQAMNTSNKDNLYIEVSIEMEDDLAIIKIEDNGCGVKKNDLKKLFKPFYSTKPAAKCGGVGLYYVERVIKLHHGDISVQSVEGEYTCFQVVLPVHKRKEKKATWEILN